MINVHYLGTGAAEGFPGLFCACPACERARLIGGKNIKTRSCALVNGRTLIDLSPDIYCQSLSQGIALHRINSIVFTHTHQDHLDRFALMLRCRDGASIFPSVPDADNHVDVYGSQDVLSAIRSAFISQPHANPERLRCTLMEEGVPVVINGVTFIPLRANHIEGETCFVYCFLEGDNAFLYGNDTGKLSLDSFEPIIKRNVVFSAVSLDCARGMLPGDSHMGLSEVRRLCDMLASCSLIDESTSIFLNHYSHMCGIIPEEFDQLVQPYGMRLTYDGLTIKIGAKEGK